MPGSNQLNKKEQLLRQTPFCPTVFFFADWQPSIQWKVSEGSAPWATTLIMKIARMALGTHGAWEQKLLVSTMSQKACVV